jgi:GT2 family glycosyltransferase
MKITNHGVTFTMAKPDSVSIYGQGSVQVSAIPNWSGTEVLGDHTHLQSKTRPRVSTIIVTYGSSKEINACLESLLKQSVPLEVFLVDNASPDNTAEVISDYAARYRNVHAILNTENVGLAAGNNTPMGKCQGEYLLMLNPDTFFRHDSLQHMVDFLDRNPEIGVVGPKNVYPNGKPHMSFGESWGLRQVLTWRVIPYRFPRFFYDRFSSYKTRDVLFVSGACLLIRRSIFEQIGGYDPEYFLTIDDVCDLCMRVKQTGSRVVFLGEEEVVHVTARSCVQAPFIVVWHGHRCTVYHFLKHKGVIPALAASFLLLIAGAARVAIAAVLGIGSARYRNIARIYARVCWGLVVRNPIWRGSLIRHGSGCDSKVETDTLPGRAV